jgi:hypothetical protein
VINAIGGFIYDYHKIVFLLGLSMVFMLWFLFMDFCGWFIAKRYLYRSYLNTFKYEGVKHKKKQLFQKGFIAWRNIPNRFYYIENQLNIVKGKVQVGLSLLKTSKMIHEINANYIIGIHLYVDGKLVYRSDIKSEQRSRIKTKRGKHEIKMIIFTDIVKHGNYIDHKITLYKTINFFDRERTFRKQVKLAMEWCEHMHKIGKRVGRVVS